MQIIISAKNKNIGVFTHGKWLDKLYLRLEGNISCFVSSINEKISKFHHKSMPAG